MTSILILKTGALGDVLRTTSILPGLRERHPGAHIEWITAPAARELVEGHAGVGRTRVVDAKSAEAVQQLGDELAGRTWDWVISLDDEEPLCRLATRLGEARLSGACLGVDGEQTYTNDVAPWFDMGLLSRFGKQEADRLKVANTLSHPEIYADMLGLPMGRPQLALPQDLISKAAVIFDGRDEPAEVSWIGLNTGAGGRWKSKQLPAERVIELAEALQEALLGPIGFVLLGGRDEAERNAELFNRLRSAPTALRVVDAGCENSLLEFAAIIDGLDLLVTSDSLALHMGVARAVPIVAFFAPTSAAEIELYGLGQKVVSRAPDYCSYRADADNSTITTERLVVAVREVLDAQSSS